MPLILWIGINGFLSFMLNRSVGLAWASSKVGTGFKHVFVWIGLVFAALGYAWCLWVIAFTIYPSMMIEFELWMIRNALAWGIALGISLVISLAVHRQFQNVCNSAMVDALSEVAHAFADVHYQFASPSVRSNWSLGNISSSSASSLFGSSRSSSGSSSSSNSKSSGSSSSGGAEAIGPAAAAGGSLFIKIIRLILIVLRFAVLLTIGYLIAWWVKNYYARVEADRFHDRYKTSPT